MGLFSTKYVHRHTERMVPYDKTVTVHEHKAPTDESVRLLNVMQEKAKKNIITTIKIDENHLKAVAIYYRDEYVSNRLLFHIMFELNGTKYEIDDCIDKFEWRMETVNSHFGLNNEVIFKLLHKKFSEVIATELMKQCPDFFKNFINER